METKTVATVLIVTVLGVAAPVLLPTALAVTRRWIAYPWWVAMALVVPLGCMGAALGICALLMFGDACLSSPFGWGAPQESCTCG